MAVILWYMYWDLYLLM